MILRSVFVLGIVGMFAATAFGQQLVTNGGFETGDLTGWTPGGNMEAFVTTSPVNTGSYSVKMTPGDNDDILYQTITTTAGATYDFSFWMIDTGRAGDDSDFDRVYWNGAIAAGSPSFVPGDNVWHQYSLDLTATGATTVMGLEAYNPAGNYYLDDVSVTPAAAPEPAPIILIGLGSVALFLRRRLA